MSRLEFAEKPWHEYRLDGRKIPSVTQIIRSATDKPGLVYASAQETALWAARSTGLLGDVLSEDEWIRAATKAPREVWDQAADDGRDLHTLAETLVLGEPMPEDVNGHPVPENVRDMAGNLARFFDAWDVEPVLAETLCYSDRYRYGGRWDLVADFDGARWLLDYKTGKPKTDRRRREVTPGVYPEVSVQLAAYGFATHYVDDQGQDQEVEALGIERAAVVWVRPDRWELVPVRYDRQVHGVFLHMGAVSAWAGQSPGQSILSPLAHPEGAAS